MWIEGGEQIGGAVAAILVIVALARSPLGRDRAGAPCRSAERGLVEVDQRPGGILRFGEEVEHVLHTDNVFAVDMGNVPHAPAPRLEVVLGQPAGFRSGELCTLRTDLALS